MPVLAEPRQFDHSRTLSVQPRAWVFWTSCCSLDRRKKARCDRNASVGGTAGSLKDPSVQKLLGIGWCNRRVVGHLAFGQRQRSGAA